MKKLKAAHYIAAVFIVGLISLVYLSQGQSETTEPLIKLSYFKSNLEVAQAIHSTVQTEIKQNKHIWFGIEPQAEREIDIYKELKNLIEKDNGAFDMVYVDKELRLSEADHTLLGATMVREIKENWGLVAKDLEANKGKNILVITAAIYSTNFIPENPMAKMKAAYGLNPLIFSMGYFAIKPEDERKIIFPCMTDNKEGIAGWGCLIVNKARTQRRRVDMAKIDPPSSLIAGLMDKTGEKDYMILIR
jgi:hypothetical protein